MAHIILSAQNFDIYEGDGLDQFARTGATSLEMIQRAGSEGVILGHSETGDSAEKVHQKLLTLVSRQLKNSSEFLARSTILVGETWEEFITHAGKYSKKTQTENSTDIDATEWGDIEEETQEQIAVLVTTQLSQILRDIPERCIQTMVIGYEPKWGSRGSGVDTVPPVSPSIIARCVQHMKAHLEKQFSKSTADAIPVIYGGRSTPMRTQQILSTGHIDGLILGSACNTIQKTLAIAQAMSSTMFKRKKILHANFKAYNLQESYAGYITQLKKLDDSFTVYLSPSDTDVRLVKMLL